ncbi:sensor histidine kinase [Actinokineospora fastidiosa]|uniref:histidine kinase n=1 Tax=Actinokineospora fastidiosa TaxID=1816 RepID=A0A918GGD5_9PSEU|nr:histidine kinase [Actinokineospora fastidiosa]GGS34168.1 two-component sensor histidine kinase [Actinokineospora fastidiosa]
MGARPGEEDVLRDRLVDAGLGGLVLAAVVVAVAVNVGDSAPAHPAAYALGPVLGALMLVRRRWPVAVLLASAAALLVYYTLPFPPVGLAVPVSAALYTAAEQGRTRWAVATAVGLLAISTVVRAMEGDDLGYLFGFAFTTDAALMTSVIAVGDGVRSRRRQAEAAAREREREAAARAERERLSIARDLHDLLAHTVTVISLHADVAREAMDDDPATARESLAAVRSACGDVVRELRATLRALRSTDDSSPLPGLSRLDALTAGLDVDLHTTGTPVPLPAVADHTAYRVLQEALSNVRKHAGTTRVDITVDYRPDALRLHIRDHGRGAAGGGAGWGIIGMRERLALLGGTLRIDAPAGGGFAVSAEIPLEGG